jgi:hypothetical protein
MDLGRLFTLRGNVLFVHCGKLHGAVYVGGVMLGRRSLKNYFRSIIRCPLRCLAYLEACKFLLFVLETNSPAYGVLLEAERALLLMEEEKWYRM